MKRSRMRSTVLLGAVTALAITGSSANGADHEDEPSGPWREPQISDAEREAIQKANLDKLQPANAVVEPDEPWVGDPQLPQPPMVGDEILTEYYPYPTTGADQ